MQVYVLLILLLGLGWGLNSTALAQKSPTPTSKKKEVLKPINETIIRADEARKVAGLPAGKESLENGKCYHTVSSRGMVSQTNRAYYVVLQEVRGTPTGPFTVWQAVGSPPRFFKLDMYLEKDSIYTFETAGTNGLTAKKIGDLPIIEMRIIPIPDPKQTPGPTIPPERGPSNTKV